jgi:hypothetical protein
MCFNATPKQIPKGHVFKWDWTTCSKYNFRFNSQPNLQKRIQPIEKHQNLHFDNALDIHASSENYEEKG